MNKLVPERETTASDASTASRRTPIRVLIADDYRVVRAGVRALLEAAPDILAVGEAATGEEALTLVNLHRPDVLVLDMSLPGLSGIAVIERLQASNSPARILAFSAFDDEQYVSAILRSGAAGYLLKDDASIDLVEAVRSVARGEGGWFSRRVMAEVAQRERTAPSGAERLTHREREILSLLARGLTNEEIAATLFLCRGTVKNHITAVYGKLGVRSRAEAVYLFCRKGYHD